MFKFITYRTLGNTIIVNIVVHINENISITFDQKLNNILGITKHRVS